ncbi:uncharacterized protein [Pyrus communis]|uniref:uncharacterized protein isoform X1 n=1 Tax=Pyrus communis TaxID=23211 RepID=UPI0035C063A1
MASLLVFITFLLLRLCTVQAVVLTLRPAVSPIYPVDLHQVRLRDHVRHVKIFKHVVGSGVNISMSYDVVFYLPAPANGVTTWEIAFQKSKGPVTIFGDIILKDKIIEYDLARQRLGWPTRDCSLPMDGCERKFWQK